MNLIQSQKSVSGKKLFTTVNSLPNGHSESWSTMPEIVLPPSNTLAKDLDNLNIEELITKDNYSFKTDEANLEVMGLTPGAFKTFDNVSFSVMFSDFKKDYDLKALKTKEHHYYFCSLNLPEDLLIPKYNTIWKRCTQKIQYEAIRHYLIKSKIDEFENIVVFEQTRNKEIHAHILIKLPLDVCIKDVKIDIADSFNLTNKHVKNGSWWDDRYIQTPMDFYGFVMYLICKHKHIYEVLNWKKFHPMTWVGDDEMSMYYNDWLKDDADEIKPPEKVKKEKPIDKSTVKLIEKINNLIVEF